MSDRSGRVLIVAPGEYDSHTVVALPGQTEEIAEIIRAFYQPVVLSGRVTERQIIDALRHGANGFWFAGHAITGPLGGLLLSDGALPARALGRYLGRAEVKWSFLNACESAELVEQLQAVHPHDVYANITAAPDADAARNAVLMAQGIADLGRINDAYHWVVAGGASSLRYFPSPSDTGSDTGVGVRDPELERRLARLERVVLGDADTGVPSWLAQSRQIDSRLRRVEWALIGAAVVILFAIFVYAQINPRQEPQVIIRVATPTPSYVSPWESP